MFIDKKTIPSDFLAGFSAMLVSFPASIAFGLIVFAPFGSSYVAMGALAGMLGSVAIGLIAPLLGGAPRLVSAPCAPAAALLAALIVDLLQTSPLQASPDLIILALALVGVAAAIFQGLLGLIGGGTLIKFIPYPVVAGYLSGVGGIIILSQIHTLLEVPLVGIVSLGTMFIAPKIIPKIPAPILALFMGTATYFLLSLFHPELQSTQNNPLVMGTLDPISHVSPFSTAIHHWQNLFTFPMKALSYLILPALALAIVLSIDTLKTCVILDTVTKSRHNSNRELFGQGVANLVSNIFGGMSGAGVMGATLVNVYGGGKTRLSGIWVGILSLIAYLFLGNVLAWIPLAALSGILIAVGIRMIDIDTIHLLKQRATWLDFLVVASVVITAITMNLMVASGLGVLLAILLFLRDQIRGSVVRRKTFGNSHFSKKRRLPDEMHILETMGSNIVIFELQGTLFFGTADQLFTEVAPVINTSRLIILDMRRVNFIDFTAAHMLKHIHALIEEKKGILIYSSLNAQLYAGKTLEAYLRYFGVLHDAPHLKQFEDLNDALEWAEEKMLQEHLQTPMHLQCTALALPEFTLFKGLPSNILNKFVQYAEIEKYEANNYIFKQGDPGGTLYLIRCGAVKILLPMGTHQNYHLTTFGRGDFFGDVSFLDQQPRSASAYAATPVELFVLSRSKFDQAVSACPTLACHFFAQIAYVLGLRLRHADAELRALEGG